MSAARCASIVFTVRNSDCAIWRFVMPFAAISATRRSLGVSDSTPIGVQRRTFSPVAVSSS